MSKSLDDLLVSLTRLADGRKYSRQAFDIPDEGFNGLSKLVAKLAEVLSEARKSEFEPEPLNKTELQYASQATNAAACAAVAAAQAADVAAQASSRAQKELAARRAIHGALRAAGAAHRAASAAQDAAMTAISLPPEAQLPYDPEIVEAIVGETERFEWIYRFLFRSEELQLTHSLFSSFTPRGQMEIADPATSMWDRLLDTLHSTTNPEVTDPLAELLKALGEGNRKLQAQLRQHALSSPAFRDPAVLQRLQSGDCRSGMELGIDGDAELRARNMELRPEMFEKQAQQAQGDESDEDYSGYTVRSGKYDKSNEDFLSFPGKINNKSVKPLIDTGGASNIVRAEWLREHGITFEKDPENSYKLLMADGSTSQDCSSISVRWSFDGKKTLWEDVDFIVVEGYHYDALIGLPFLKVTETIHNSEGQLVFPEFRGVHAEKDAIPIYDTRVKKSK